MRNMKQRAIAVIIQEGLSHDRGILRGATQQARLHPSLRLIVLPYTSLQYTIEILPQLGSLIGVVGRVAGEVLTAAAQRLGMPVVTTSHLQESPCLSRVSADDLAVGRMAADHLLSLGLRHLGYVGFGASALSVDRGAGFAAAVLQAGQALSLGPSIGWGPIGREPVPEEADLCDWLKQLPKPSGVLAATDATGRRVLELCHHLNIRVAEELAVLGVDNDELACELTWPPMSSIALPCEQIGREAIELLLHQARARLGTPAVRLLPPTRVVCRRSTDTVASDQPSLARALAFIHDHRHQPITVSDVQGAVGLSRRSLEMMFQRFLHRTPLQEIHRVHVEHARQLLSDTNLSMDAIARNCGLVSRSQLSRIFRTFTGETPAAFRHLRQTGRP